MEAKLSRKKQAGALVYVLTQEGQRPAAVITNQQIADEWANSATDRDYFSFNVDDFVATDDGQVLNTVENDTDSNFGREGPR